VQVIITTGGKEEETNSTGIPPEKKINKPIPSKTLGLPLTLWQILKFHLLHTDRQTDEQTDR
jgi:hypothetical protein